MLHIICCILYNAYFVESNVWASFFHVAHPKIWFWTSFWLHCRRVLTDSSKGERGTHKLHTHSHTRVLAHTFTPHMQWVNSRKREKRMLLTSAANQPKRSDGCWSSKRKAQLYGCTPYGIYACLYIFIYLSPRYNLVRGVDRLIERERTFASECCALKSKLAT